MTDDKVLSVLHQDGCYSVSFLQTLYSFFEADMFCDITLQVQDEIIKAHRVVLAASSVYFKAMFGGNLAEKSKEVVVIHDVDPAALKAIIKYAYTSEIQVTETNVQNIMCCANMLQMTSIVNACAEFLLSRLHPANCLGIQQYAALYSCYDLETKARLYSQEHFKDVATQDEFLLLPQSLLIQLISADHLDVESEEGVFAAIMRWVKYDQKTRCVFLHDLLKHVRFHLLSPNFIQRQANFEPMLTEFADKFARSTTDNFLLNSDTSARYSKTEQVIFALGGESTGYLVTNIQCFSTQNNIWQNSLPSCESSVFQATVDSMETARTSFAAVADGKYIYAAGGTTSVQALDTVEVYSGTNNTWSFLPPMTECRNGCKAALLNGALYVVGGHDGFRYLDTIEAFDLRGNSWEHYAPMSTPRGFGCCAVIDAMLYVLGGTDGNANEADIYHSEMERYDPRQNVWTQMAPMLQARAYFAAVVLNNCIYAIGGFNGRWLNTVEKYDPRTNRWHNVRALSLPRSSFSATVHNGCIYVGGGFTGKANVNTVERYDPCTDRWRPACGMSMCRYGLQLVNVQVPCRK